MNDVWKENVSTGNTIVMGIDSYVMVDKILAQNETSTSQKFTNLQIVGDLSASTTCRHQLLGCCDQLAEGVSRCWSWIPFFRGVPCPRLLLAIFDLCHIYICRHIVCLFYICASMGAT